MFALKENSSNSWHLILMRVIRPIARFALRHGVKIQEIHRALAQALIEEARGELAKSGAANNVSRICVMTGIHRREVSRYLDVAEVDSEATLLGRVVGLWQHAKRFRSVEGFPKPLDIGFADASFNILVREVSKELNPASVLFELERTGAVTVSDGKAILVRGSYTPSNNFVAGVAILGADIDDLIHTTENNLLGEKQEKSLHVRTSFDAVRISALGELKRWIKQEGHEFHRKVREKVSQYDQDINPEVGYSGDKAQVVVTSFSHVVGD